MELEYLPDGNPDCPILLFSPSVPMEALQLYRALHDIVSVSGTTVDIHTLSFISPVDGCQLTAQVGEQNIGAVLNINSENHFNCELTRETWKEVLDYLYPFTIQDYHDDRYTRYQWLDETSHISLLISTGHRRW